VRQQTEGDPERRAAVLAGLRAYQEAERVPRPPEMPVVARAGRAVLRDYGGRGPPAVFVPSLINPPFILDLTEGNSLLRWLVTQGVRPLLVDWGTPDPPLRASKPAAPPPLACGERSPSPRRGGCFWAHHFPPPPSARSPG
jgi:polyhydroxyalkanoate synthase subunit PhaC